MVQIIHRGLTGRSSTPTADQHVNKINELMLENLQLTVRDLTDIVGLSEVLVKTILKNHLELREVKTQIFLAEMSILSYCT